MALSPSSSVARAARIRGQVIPSGVVYWVVLLGALVLLFGAIAPVLWAAFSSVPLYESGGVPTLANFASFLSDARFWAAFGNTAQFALWAAIPAVLIGTALAVLVTRTSMPARRLVGALMLMPLLFPGLGSTLGWVSMYSPKGFVSVAAMDVIGWVPWNLYSIPGMALVTLERTVPLVYLLVRARLSTLDTAIEQAALVSGAKPARVLTTITLPMLRPSLLMAGVLISMMAFEALGLPLILGTPAGIETLSTFIYNGWTREVGNQGVVSAVASVLLLVVALLMIVRTKLEGDSKRFITGSGKPGQRRQLNLGWFGIPATVLALLWVLFAVALPTFGLVMTAITPVFTPLVSPFEVLTLRHFEIVLSSPAFSRSIVNSLVISVVGAVIATVALAIAAYVAHRSDFRFRRLLPPLLLFPRALPGIIVGMGFFWAFAIFDPADVIRTSIWGIMIAFVVRNTAVGYGAIESTLQSISGELDAAARTCGANWLRTGRTIIFPLLKPALGASFILMFVAVLNDYDPAVFLMTSGNEVIGLTMLRQWMAGFGGPVAALGVIQMIITIAVLGIGRLLFGVKPHV